MQQVRAIFWDVGGVLLSNAWDREQRARVVKQFGLDAADFQERHQLIVPELETGRLSLREYLDQTVFYRPVGFDHATFEQAITQQSSANEQTLELARRLSSANDVRMYALNNESRELNEYRIRTFGLGRLLLAFFTSCSLGVSKPGPTIYRLALQLAQVQPGQALMIDDRLQNVEMARMLGMRALQFVSGAQLQQDLEALGFRIPTSP